MSKKVPVEFTILLPKPFGLGLHGCTVIKIHDGASAAAWNANPENSRRLIFPGDQILALSNAKNEMVKTAGWDNHLIAKFVKESAGDLVYLRLRGTRIIKSKSSSNSREKMLQSVRNGKALRPSFVISNQLKEALDALAASSGPRAPAPPPMSPRRARDRHDKHVDHKYKHKKHPTGKKPSPVKQAAMPAMRPEMAAYVKRDRGRESPGDIASGHAEGLIVESLPVAGEVIMEEVGEMVGEREGEELVLNPAPVAEDVKEASAVEAVEGVEGGGQVSKGVGASAGGGVVVLGNSNSRSPSGNVGGDEGEQVAVLAESDSGIILAPAELWECSLCTYPHNSMSSQLCEVCRSPAPQDNAPLSPRNRVKIPQFSRSVTPTISAPASAPASAPPSAPPSAPASASPSPCGSPRHSPSVSPSVSAPPSAPASPRSSPQPPSPQISLRSLTPTKLPDRSPKEDENVQAQKATPSIGAMAGLSKSSPIAGSYLQAGYDFKGSNPAELSVIKDELLYIFQVKEEWSLVARSNNSAGWIPTAYLKPAAPNLFHMFQSK